jgi:hypothetical protein
LLLGFGNSAQTADFQMVTKMKKPDIRCAHLRVLFFPLLMKVNFQRKEKIKPGTFVPGFFICRGEKTRTSGPYVPNVVRYQLRHTPIYFNKKERCTLPPDSYRDAPHPASTAEALAKAVLNIPA